MDNYDKLAHANNYPTSSVILTESGVRGILLAHLTTAETNEDDQFMVIFKTIGKLMRKCDEAGIKTVAIPELRTGVIGNLTQTQSAKAIFGAVYKYAVNHKKGKIESVTLVVYGDDTHAAEQVLADETYKNFQNESGAKEFDIGTCLEEMARE